MVIQEGHLRKEVTGTGPKLGPAARQRALLHPLKTFSLSMLLPISWE